MNTGSSIECNATITDNINVDTAIANVTLPNGTIVQPGVSNVGSDYTFTYTIPDDVTTYTVLWIVNDTSSNLNNTESTTFDASDATNPAVTLLVCSPDPVNTGSSIECNATITDNINLGNVSVNITLPNSSVVQPTGFNNIGSEYSFTFVVPEQITTYTVLWIVNDTSNNINNTESTTFDATDTVLPSVPGAQILPVTDQEAGTLVTILANVTDNDNVDEVYANLTQNNGTLTQIQLFNTTSTPDIWNGTYTAPADLGTVNILIISNDTAGNVNDTETAIFTVIDTTTPSVIIETPAGGSTFTQGDDVAIDVNVTDFLPLSNVIITVELSNTSGINYTPGDANSDNIFNFTFNETSQLGTYNISVFGNDSTNNINNTVWRTFIVAEASPEVIDEGGDSCDPDWDCGEWSSCSDGQMTRECVDIEECDEDGSMPDTAQSCECESNSECGSDGYINNPVCDSSGDVIQQYRTYTCNDDNECRDHTETVVKDECLGSTSSCSAGSCVECNSNSDCSTGQACENNICVEEFFNPEDPSTECLWVCNDWDACSNGVQERECSNFLGDCDPSDPPIYQACSCSGPTCDNPFFNSTEISTGYAHAPCYASASAVGVERAATGADIYVGAGREILTEPITLTCTPGEKVELTVIAPIGYTDYKPHLCRGGECGVIKATNVSELLCENGLVTANTRLENIYTPDYDSLEIPVVEGATMAETPGFSFTFSNASQTSLSILPVSGTLTQPANPSIALAGSPVRLVIQGDRNITGIFTLSHKELVGIEEGSLSILVLRNKTWDYIGGTPDDDSVTIELTLEDLFASESDIVVALAGSICTDCGESTLNNIYRAKNAKAAIVLIHGFDTGPATFQAMVNDIKLTEENIDVWLFSYSQSNTLTASIDDLNERMQSVMGGYDSIVMLGHSLGGIVAQESVYLADKQNMSFVERVTDLVIMGAPNNGLNSLTEFEEFFGTMMEARTLFRIFNIESKSILDLKNHLNTPRVDHIEYNVVAGTETFVFELGPATIRTDELIGLSGDNDGLLSTKDARTIGGGEITARCENYWELDLTHTQLDESFKARQLVGNIITRRLGIENTELGGVKYIKVFIPSCETGDHVAISGVPFTGTLSAEEACLQSVRAPSCSDNKKNQNERSADCGGNCGLCKTDYVFIFVSLLSLIFFIYVTGKEIAHLIAEHMNDKKQK